jgi:membrane-associated phospholipid phosphatase
MMDFDIWNGNYQPGLWEQDLLTLPLEAGLILGMNSTYTKTPRQLVPFKQEVFPSGRNPSQHTKSFLVPAGLIWGGGVLGGLAYAVPEKFSLYPAVAGLAHAHLLTEVFTSFSKLSFQRPRPFLEAEKTKGNAIRDDDRLSFFSGHSSHVFAFSAYTSAMIWQSTDNGWVRGFYTLFAASAASWVGSSRAIRGQHNWSDVIVGAAVGSATGIWVRCRTYETEKKLREKGADISASAWSLQPLYLPHGKAVGLEWRRML